MQFLLLITLIILFTMQCSPGEGNNHLKKGSPVVFTDEYEEVEDPPRDFQSKFSSIQEWLEAIVDSEQPEEDIEIFSFGIFESANDYTMYLVGLQTQKKQDSSITRIGYKPQYMYYRLQKNEFENLDRDQVLSKIKGELKKFIDSEKFKSSFMGKGKSVRLEYAGEIWSNATD